MSIPKAAAGDFVGRYREIVSDPLNLCIARVEQAGTIAEGLVVLHNGHRVPFRGPGAYYGSFSDILIINRGVHEPLEEFVFQEVLKRLPDAPIMVELGAYWAHYSMWLLQKRPEGRVIMVEPGDEERRAGEANFQRHGYRGTFIAAKVGAENLTIDQLIRDQRLSHVSILHSDIQGYEVQMLAGATETLSTGKVDNIFISTHSQHLHATCAHKLTGFGYRVEAAADFLTETTSHDGFIFARRANLPPIFRDFQPLGRQAIMAAAPVVLRNSILNRVPE